jgi:hypothetical protein
LRVGQHDALEAETLDKGAAMNTSNRDIDTVENDDDFIAGRTERGKARPDLEAEEVADLRQYRALRHRAFIGVSGLIVALATLFILWTVAFGVRLFLFGGNVDSSSATMILTPIAVMAALVAVPLLAMIRFIFRRQHQSDDLDEAKAQPIWQTLIKEVVDLFKSYLSRGKAAA